MNIKFQVNYYIYFMFNARVAKKQIKNIKKSDKELANVGKNIFRKTEIGRHYLVQVFTIKDFSPSYDKKIANFLKDCIPCSFSVTIRHELDGKAKIILT